MNRRLFAAIALVGAGCSTTTTVGSINDERARWWLAEQGSSEIRVGTDRGPDRTTFVVDATSPTEIRLRVTSQTTVPIENVRRLTVVEHGRGALDGALLGVAIGATVGALYGLTRGLSAYESSMDCTIVCNNTDAAEWGALEFGVLGLLSGVVTGAVVGHRDILELR